MSGHSKWANIKRKKEANDKVKSNVFSKLSRLITMAVLEGGGITDPENNIKLRLAIDKARVYNMPRSNIDRAVDRAAGSETQNLRTVQYEGFGPKGAGLIIEASTDNPNRTSSEIRNTLERFGGKLGAQGSVSYLFQRCGVVHKAKTDTTEEAAFALGEKLGALDIDQDDTYYSIYIPFEAIGRAENAEIDFRPQTYVDLPRESLHLYEEMIGAIEDLEDVHKVFTNARFAGA